VSTLLGRALTLLGALAILSCTGIIGLAVLSRPIPDVLQNIAVGSMTALGALLARSAGGDSRADEAPERPDTRT
jgi:hypothetical protein